MRTNNNGIASIDHKIAKDTKPGIYVIRCSAYNSTSKGLIYISGNSPDPKTSLPVNLDLITDSQSLIKGIENNIYVLTSPPYPSSIKLEYDGKTVEKKTNKKGTVKPNLKQNYR